MKKQLLSLGAFLVLALGTLPGMAACCCQNNCCCPQKCEPCCPQVKQCCPVQKCCPQRCVPCCPVKVIAPGCPCPALPIKNPCCNTYNDCCD